jgi:hypothetical protein
MLSDGNGLQLRVRTSGSKLWNFNYKHSQTTFKRQDLTRMAQAKSAKGWKAKRQKA